MVASGGRGDRGRLRERQAPVSLVRLTADRPERPDKHMDEKEANVFHLDDKGRAYEFWGVADDQASLNSFWTD